MIMEQPIEENINNAPQEVPVEMSSTRETESNHEKVKRVLDILNEKVEGYRARREIKSYYEKTNAFIARLTEIYSEKVVRDYVFALFLAFEDGEESVSKLVDLPGGDIENFIVNEL